MPTTTTPKLKKPTTKPTGKKTMPPTKKKKIIPQDDDVTPKFNSKFFKKNPEIDDDARMISDDWNDEDEDTATEDIDDAPKAGTVIDVNAAILKSLDKLTSIMIENNDNTKKIMKQNQEEPVRIVTKNVTEVEPANQFNDMKQTQKRINLFSRDLSKQLEKVNESIEIETKDQDDKNNADFLKVMSQNFTALEAEVARNTKRIEQLNRDNETKDRNIEELKKSIMENRNFVNNVCNQPHIRKVNLQKEYDTTEKETDAETDDFVKPKRKKNRKRLPVIPTSPIDPEDILEIDDNPTSPPLTYAQVFNGKFKKPKIPIAQHIIDENPEDKLVDNSNIEDDLDEEQRELIGQAIEDSAKIIGFSPITESMKNAEADKILKNGLLNKNSDKRDLYETATKNLIDKFMKNKLKMDNFDRNQVNIIQIYPSQSDRSPTIYIKCQSEDDISLITSHANTPTKTYP